ncbi:MAG TPA: transketolase C-terminal domain-containing protein [Chthoniobacteraceae bacterium]|nr:transketolase C-terminal domain-containing protein [Chthoniobacteraceae bacterium]
MNTLKSLNLDPHKTHGAIREIALGKAANSLSELLLEYGERDPRLCYVGVDTMDAAFQKRFPERAFDVGIAEQNELGLATGLAKVGLLPVVQGWSPFTPLRNFDQLRTYLCRHQSNVKIVTTTLGLANCSHGTTHHDLESIALYRTVPNLVVLAAMDDAQFRAAFHAAMAHEGPVVVMGPPELYAPGADARYLERTLSHGTFTIGRAEWLRRGEAATVFAVGSALHYALDAAGRLDAEGISVGVVNMCSLKPFDSGAVLEALSISRVILSVEEQNPNGGLGSAVAETIAESGIAARFQRMAIPDQYVENLGDWTYTRQGVGLTADRVISRLKRLLGRE